MKQRYDGTAYVPITLTETPAEPARRQHLHVVPSKHRGEDLVADGELQSMELGGLELELGGRLPGVTVAYRTWGKLNAAGDNAVVVLHALTGDSRAGGEDGWWGPLIGPGRALDTDRAFVVCANILGGCQGTTGPASLDPLTGRPYAMRFPLITIGDMVAAQRRLVERLGITKLIAIGGSIGGCQALEWATRHADLVAASVPVGATPALEPMGIALNEAGRRAIMADPDWRGGEYASEGVFPAEGLAIARMIAMTTFHSRESLGMRFGRRPATRPSLYPSFGGTFDVEGYIHYHGAALVRRFDANSHLYLTRAMDLYDLGSDGGEERWLQELRAPMLLVGIRSDWLYPPDEVKALADRVAAVGKEVAYEELDSPHGHDAFLKEWDQLTEVIKPFMDRALPEADV
ncbi:MAG: homoserine O-acetyltransferase/O-succinyltransferase [Thermomicrobiales bacterium]|jgi:homoserine O-acetyltransferase|nr:homoserine O-acetyltransferase/O-succinyltransferase [Thermomicrobiales bacterium]MEA2597505.1 homoserine O-acetyltransferase/O-succinyltransferase [Thermomicrobiales bacterium]